WPGRSRRARPSRSASCPAPEIWKKTRLCFCRPISRSSSAREVHARRRSSRSSAWGMPRWSAAPAPPSVAGPSVSVVRWTSGQSWSRRSQPRRGQRSPHHEEPTAHRRPGDGATCSADVRAANVAEHPVVDRRSGCLHSPWRSPAVRGRTSGLVHPGAAMARTGHGQLFRSHVPFGLQPDRPARGRIRTHRPRCVIRPPQTETRWPPTRTTTPPNASSHLPRWPGCSGSTRRPSLAGPAPASSTPSARSAATAASGRPRSNVSSGRCRPARKTPLPRRP
ncbi:MAG: hypothetical protein AVDCRST_MAG20-2117, partial [uncultured Acidimicrobiales bacterium]